MTHVNTFGYTDSLLAAEPGSPIIVALKPFGECDSAITMARRLADRQHGELQAISVIEMGEMGTAVAGLPPLPEEYYQRERDEVASDMRSRMARPGHSPPRVDVVEGAPGSTIAGIAAARQAHAIVIGTGQHGMLGRFLYGERALEVVRSAASAVLVVPTYAEPPLRRALVAVDFSRASLRAAVAALEMLDDGGRLTLVHVRNATRHLDGRSRQAEEDGEEDVRPHFARFLPSLPETSGIEVETEVLRGDAVGALLRYVEEHEVDLIACGRRRHSIVERLLVGSVSTAIIRGAPCSVIVAPERPEDDEGTSG